MLALLPSLPPVGSCSQLCIIGLLGSIRHNFERPSVLDTTKPALWSSWSVDVAVVGATRRARARARPLTGVLEAASDSRARNAVSPSRVRSWPAVDVTATHYHRVQLFWTCLLRAMAVPSLGAVTGAGEHPGSVAAFTRGGRRLTFGRVLCEITTRAAAQETWWRAMPALEAGSGSSTACSRRTQRSARQGLLLPPTPVRTRSQAGTHQYRGARRRPGRPEGPPRR